MTKNTLREYKLPPTNLSSLQHLPLRNKYRPFKVIFLSPTSSYFLIFLFFSFLFNLWTVALVYFCVIFRSGHLVPKEHMLVPPDGLTHEVQSQLIDIGINKNWHWSDLSMSIYSGKTARTYVFWPVIDLCPSKVS